MSFIAHIDEKGNAQTIKQHSENTADLCRTFSILKLKNEMYIIGLLHDIGKYQISFSKRLENKKVKVEHSTCGALVAKERFNGLFKFLCEYCIAGHHSGIPDGGSYNDSPDMSTLVGRLKRDFEDYSEYKNELKIPEIDETEFHKYILEDCTTKKECVERFAFIVRYCFSCLTDADSIDTENFCNGNINRELKSDFEKCLEKVNKKLSSFEVVTALQKARSYLQSQVYKKVSENSDIFLMNMPTGSGKTLCSIKFALEKALRTGKKRIIYVIPYNSIIDQTVKEFEKIFGEDAQILRHQSTFSYEKSECTDENYINILKFAIENWNADIIITTAVQFFESMYSNKRGKLRKLHNMADSILIFDEAHLMPLNFLQPCLRSIYYITKYLNSNAVFLTATMPNFKEIMNKYVSNKVNITELIEDRTHFSAFSKCKYEYIGIESCETLIDKTMNNPSNLIIVNKRSTAKKLYSLCTGRKFHLSTYMTAFDRETTIEKIKKELAELEKDYPNFDNVPFERRITVISTSLIEAGVDLDFYTVFRELSGLDSILQSGGRCNREGKRTTANVYVFELEEEITKIKTDDGRGNITKELFKNFEDISSAEAIKLYYDQLFFIKSNDITKKSLSNDCTDFKYIPFAEYSRNFEIIDSNTISIVVERDDISHNLIENLKNTHSANSRELQKYAFSVYIYEFDDLLKQHVVNDFDSGIYCLTNFDYYNAETGVVFEGEDKII